MTVRWYIFFMVAALVTATGSGPAAAEGPFPIEGKYAIKGWDPGNPPEGEPDYEGRAILSRWGETWRYHGFMDDMTYAGAAIFDSGCGTLSLSFTNGDGSERGVTLLWIKGAILEGVWVLDNGGDGKPGYEIWTRQ